MASPSMVQRSGDTLIVRSVVSGNRLFVDGTEDNEGPDSRPESPPTVELMPEDFVHPTGEDGEAEYDPQLPQCKIKRNYNCCHCNYFTQNPRHYLTHLRDVHLEKVKIYDCPHCLYASRHFQKLLRHMKMVHGTSKPTESTSLPKAKSLEALPISESTDYNMDGVEFPNRIEFSPPEVVEPVEVVPPIKSSSPVNCPSCPFVTKSRHLLARHERKEHVKSRYFPCSKCNYVTHIKARFTKHVKYHSMPMIKCEVCDFRTPYKWNLDRHMKNHGGNGLFCCSACNFTADIKQSLTVHEMNHHNPPVGQGASGAAGGAGPGTGQQRRRNKVGASDSLLPPLAPPPVPNLGLQDNASSGDSYQSDTDDMVIAENDNDKLSEDVSTPKTMHFQNFIHNDESANMNSASFQSPNTDTEYKPNWLSEMLQREEQNKLLRMKKPARPIPNLIPLQVQSPQAKPGMTPLNLSVMSKGSLESNESKYLHTSERTNDSNQYNEDSADQANFENFSMRGSDESQHSTQVSKVVFKKKNASFFDKLKEKLMTTTAESGNLMCKECGHVSKCLSEYSAHEKVCSNTESKSNHSSFLSAGSGSTRCQHCRHRCKSSSDLVIHMQSCPLIGKNRDSPVEAYKTDKIVVPIQPGSEEEASVDDPQVRHPMENVVFVWNSMFNQSDSPTFDNQNSQNEMDLSTNSNDNQNINNNFMSSTPHNLENGQSTSNASSGKKVFKCPHCSFWATTASRFHVHIVGHLNKKPFECSLCTYRSNWRWDITKHIRLKSVRDPEHAKARVLMTDETGRRNYSKYLKYFTLMQVAEPDDAGTGKKSKETHGNWPKSFSYTSDNSSNFGKDLTSPSPTNLYQERQEHLEMRPPSSIDFSKPDESDFNMNDESLDNKKSKKSMWKCKKCSFRHSSKEALLIHVRKHSKSNSSRQEDKMAVSETAGVSTSADSGGGIAYRCGHCNQVSNWKHVIQRHCRLKHNGDVKVIVGEKEKPVQDDQVCVNGRCGKCPFTSPDKNILDAHFKQHAPRPDSIFKCFMCPFFVKNELELIQHLPLHGVNEPEQYIANLLESSKPVQQQPENVLMKRYKCTKCPYVSNSKSQFIYHEQFHGTDAPYKCDVCNYQVSKRHLLHQHMKVHGISSSEKYIVAVTAMMENAERAAKFAMEEIETDFPLLWVSFEGEYKKMHQCGYCPYVNTRKSNIEDHMNMHKIHLDPHVAVEHVHRCSQCSYVCSNAGTYLAHIKVHRDGYVRVLSHVDLTKSDEQQIAEFKTQAINEENMISFDESNNTSEIVSETNVTSNTDFSFTENMSAQEGSALNENKLISSDANKPAEKKLYFCPNCPARFLFEKELHIHCKFHTIRLPYQCQVCSYTARQHAHLLAHRGVHSEDYQIKTKDLQEYHGTHPEHAQPKIVVVVAGLNVSEPVWVVVAGGTPPQPEFEYGEPMDECSIDDANSKIPKQHVCNQCPAKFFKNTGLQYHLKLHGGDGHFKCKQCNYAVKTIGNLVKHEIVHENHKMTSQFGSNEDLLKTVPLSGTDLFQHKAEAEKRALSEKFITRPNEHFPPVLQADPQFGLLMHGNPDFIYPTYMKNGRQKEKRYKCHKCPSAFEKREQYKVHLSLHGSKQRYKCEICDYSVKYYANYVQHMRKHQMNADAHAARNEDNSPMENLSQDTNTTPASSNNIKLAVKSLPRYLHRDSSRLSASDQQTLKLLNRRRSSTASNKDPTEEKKIFRCTYCPYNNQRRDALDNHMRRHTSLSGTNTNFTCAYCDYSAPQSQFLRDHLKIHFTPQKHLAPEYYANFDGLSVYVSKIDDAEKPKEEAKCIFKATDDDDVKLDLSPKEINKIYVIPNTGERVER